MQEEVVLIGPFKFNYSKGYLCKGKEEKIYMTPRLAELLNKLLASKNRLVTREDLLSSVWKDVIVGEDSLTKAVSDLRKFLKDCDIPNVTIHSIAKRGYKLEISTYAVLETNGNRFGRTLLKGVLYTISFLVIIVILIRAIFSSGYSL